MLHRPHSVLWWTKKRNYVVYILRELSAVFVALAALGTVVVVHQVRQGDAAWSALLRVAASPAVTAIAVVALAFVLLHTFTFIEAARKALIVRIGGKRVSGENIVRGHYAAWLVGTVVIAWAVLS
jgi:fumarate reductase subunit C